MANVDSPFGASAINSSDSGDYHAKGREVEFLASDATAAFIGDPVKLTGTTGADGYTPVVEVASPGDAIIGFLHALAPTFEDEGSLTLNYRLASTARKGYVTMGADVLFVMQEDSDGGALTAADAGLNVDFVAGPGDTITGLSGFEIDSSTADTTATLPLRLRRVAPEQDNELGDNANWVVNINANQDDHGLGV